jgi:3-phosphoshikimate 1-carboxyvinyltransferase
VPAAISDQPVLALWGWVGTGSTFVLGGAELRVKESDRIAAVARMLAGFGVAVEERADGVVIEGRSEGRLRAARIESGGDHRIAMSAAVLALAGDAPSRITDVDCIRTSFPRFVGTLRALGAVIEVV